MPRFLLGLSGGLYSFDPASPANAPQSILPGVQPLALATDPATPRRVYCATYNRGLWRSEDGGDTWQPVGTPQDYFRPLTKGALPTLATTFVAVAPHPDEQGRHAVWVGTEPSGLYQSSDYGETFALVTAFGNLASRRTWSFPPRPGTHHVRWIAYGLDNEVYVAIKLGALLRSFDGSRTFEDRRPGAPLDIHVLRTHPAAPSRLYAATGDGFLHAGHAWAESHDHGATWQYASRGLEAMPYLYGLAVNAGDPDDIRLAAAPSVRAAHETGPSSIYRRVGNAWVEDAAGFPRAQSLIPVLAADARQAGRWYALSNLGLFRQEPGASAWELATTLPAWETMHPTCFAQVVYG
ncbi:hypothetical protein QMK33_21930 [Hymenobacter sp. H14-R3]|uniref:WD40/YVTN/BNR-like repeat-containing protein n=1 Tax=Hymenobacter sp. H14-R3 TaxID=3046308 RepID=UPI0024B8F236|nr:hypothetical protein [Hymenobacter sp. H14-R3]MDJ0367814.1 hypothetical protein [Hymenobacter sp. H14-R3]